MNEWAQRRKQFVDRLEGGVAIIPGARTKLRNADTEYPFRQNSDFAYLTGFPEPDAVAVLSGGANPQYTLFVRPKDRSAEIWTGHRYGVEGAQNFFGADAAYTIDELKTYLPGLLVGNKQLAYLLGEDEAQDRLVFEAVREARYRVRRGGSAPEMYTNPGSIIHEMRLRKSPEELATLRRGAAITAAGFDAGIQATRPGLMEYQLEAIIEATYADLGAQDLAYPSIVAGGANATTLHYNTNRAPLRDGTLVLVDSGCELNSYASDVTRTWPVNGRFTAEQRALYDIVLAAQEAAFLELVPGKTFDAYHWAAVRGITAGLIELGILKGTLESALERHAYNEFYMHRTGHWLGLDVHDVGSYTLGSAYRALEPSMVLTVEPGIYISPNSEVDPRFHGIGIRIEDDVCITAGEPEILTAAIPKHPSDLEALVGSKQKEGA